MFVCNLDFVKSEETCRMAAMFLRKWLLSFRGFCEHRSTALIRSETYSRMPFHLTITGHDLQVLIYLRRRNFESPY
jgi:hypothetical protein